MGKAKKVDAVQQQKKVVAKLQEQKGKAKAKRDELQAKVNEYDREKKNSKAYAALFERLNSAKAEVKDFTTQIKCERVAVKNLVQAKRTAKADAKAKRDLAKSRSNADDQPQKAAA